MMRTLLCLLVGSSAFAAGPLSFGVKGGLPLTDFFDTINRSGPGGLILNSNTNRYIVGPTAELKLPLGLSFEVDALYRHFGYNTSFTDVLTNNRTTGSAWEFPLLAKYRLHAPLIRPFVDAGIAFDTLSGIKQTTSFFSGTPQSSTTSNPAELRNSTTKGFVMGFGAEIHAIVVKISPEIRYTRWGSAHFSIPNGSTLSNQNQAEFLIGFTF